MAKVEDDEKELEAEADEAEGEAPTSTDEARGEAALAAGAEPAEARAADPVPAQLGATKYVHAAFFAGGILIAYLSGKMLALVWNSLAAWGEAVRRGPVLLRYAEDERDGIMLAVGAVIGVISVVQAYRNERIRTYADEVAAELAKVTWPTRETVVNGTIVVIVASAIATVYVALLDRFWGFLTNLVYGA